MIASKIGTIYELPSLIDDFKLTIYKFKFGFLINN
jgi:hypothetical protein